MSYTWRLTRSSWLTLKCLPLVEPQQLLLFTFSFQRLQQLNLMQAVVQRGILCFYNGLKSPKFEPHYTWIYCVHQLIVKSRHSALILRCAFGLYHTGVCWKLRLILSFISPLKTLFLLFWYLFNLTCLNLHTAFTQLTKNYKKNIWELKTSANYFLTLKSNRNCKVQKLVHKFYNVIWKSLQAMLQALVLFNYLHNYVSH